MYPCVNHVHGCTKVFLKPNAKPITKHNDECTAFLLKSGNVLNPRSISSQVGAPVKRGRTSRTSEDHGNLLVLPDPQYMKKIKSAPPTSNNNDYHSTTTTTQHSIFTRNEKLQQLYNFYQLLHERIQQRTTPTKTSLLSSSPTKEMDQFLQSIHINENKTRENHQLTMTSLSQSLKNTSQLDRTRLDTH